MEVPDIGRLPDDIATAADGVIDSVIEVAAREMSAVGSTQEAALLNAWARIQQSRPEVWAIAVLRLKETECWRMLALATGERVQ